MNHWTPRHPRAALRLGLALLAASMALVLYSSSARAAAPSPSPGTCTTGTSPHGHKLIRCLNKTWHCDAPVHDLQVNVVVQDAPTKVDAIHLDAGCTGNLRARVQTDSGDGFKVHAGAHDLKVWMGAGKKGKPAEAGHGGKVGILCSGKHGDVHQDGVQAMGGYNVTFLWPNVTCPSGNNGGLFVSAGGGNNSTPTGIIFRHGWSYERNAAIHIGDVSKASGAVDVWLKTGLTKASPKNCIRTEKTAEDPVDDHNHCTTTK